MTAPSPPLWKASVTLPKEHAPDMTALLELAPPKPQAVLILEDPFGPDAIVEALYDCEADAAFLSRLTGRTVDDTREEALAGGLSLCHENQSLVGGEISDRRSYEQRPPLHQAARA